MSYDVPAGPPTFPPPPPGGPFGGPPVVPGQGLAPVLVAFDPALPQSRGTVLIRFLMVIPHLIVLWALGIAAGVVAIIGWFAALFTGQLPAFAADFLSGYLRWQTRVYAYSVMLTDVYPPFTLEDVPYPVRVVTLPGPLNRLAVLFRIILVIPAWFVAAFAGLGAYTIVAFVTWLIVLIRGSMPTSLHQAYAAVLRYTARTSGYYLMLTSAYPGGLFGDTPDAAYAPPPGFPPQPGFPPPPGFAPEPGFTPEPGFPSSGAPTPDEGFTAAPGFPPPPPGFPPPPPGFPPPPPGAPAPDQGFTPGPGFASPGSPPAPGFPPPPGYGPPRGGPEAGFGPPAGGPGNPWLLVLSRGARRLVIWFLVIGVLVLGGIIASDAALASNTVTRVQAFNSLQSAANTINAASESAGNSIQACGQNLSCVQKYYGHLATAYGTLGTSVQGIAMPTGQDSAAAATVAADASKVANLYHQLATASSVTQFTGIEPSAESALNTLKNDFDSLQSSLAS